MFKITTESYGYHLIFSKTIDAEQMKEWLDESKLLLSKAPKNFGVLIDMRTLTPLKIDAQRYMQEGQRLYKSSGMVRSAVILDDENIKIQFKRIAWQTGIYEWERYINASANRDWYDKGIKWIQKRIDPDPIEDSFFIDSVLEEMDQ